MSLSIKHTLPSSLVIHQGVTCQVLCFCSNRRQQLPPCSPLPPSSPPFLPFLPPSHLLYCLLLFLFAFIPLLIPLFTPPSGLRAVKVFWSMDKKTNASCLHAITEVTISHSGACTTGLYHVHMVQRLLGPTSAPGILFVLGQGGQETHSPCVVLESWFNY